MGARTKKSASDGSRTVCPKCGALVSDENLKSRPRNVSSPSRRAFNGQFQEGYARASQRTLIDEAFHHILAMSEDNRRTLSERLNAIAAGASFRWFLVKKQTSESPNQSHEAVQEPVAIDLAKLG